MIQRILTTSQRRRLVERTGTSRSVPRQICTLAGTATLALAASTASAQVTCACSNLIPPNMQIDDCRQNETGSPTHQVGFGATTDMRHANRFQPGITVTHVCVALNAVVTQGEIQFRTVGAGGMPGGTFYTQPFSLAPNPSGFQLVELTTPQAPATEYWLTIEYPNAPGGQPHQHTGPRVAGQAAVHPVGFGGWEDYDNVGATGYVNNAPVIRALQLSQTGGPTPCVTCPAGANQVCGSCGSTPGVCDGCNGTHFQTAECNETYCGELQADSTIQEEHWYELNVPAVSSGQALIGLTFEADMDLSIEVHDGNCSQPPGMINGMFLPACTQQSLSTVVSAPGTYHIRVRPAPSVTNHPCGTANTYVMEVHYWDDITGEHCPSPGPPTCPPAANDCFVTSSGPGCSDPACCDDVCQFDPFCCNTTWDSICVGGAVSSSQCIGCGDPGNDCCSPGVGPHCDDAQCCVDVCAIDPSCCEMDWHAGCASLAQQHCATCSQGPPLNNDCSGADTVLMGSTFFDFGGATPTDPPDPVCGFGGIGSSDNDLWFEFTSTSPQGTGREFEFALLPDPASPQQTRHISLYSSCPGAGGVVIDCDTAVGGAPAVAHATLVPGDVVFVRVAAPFGGSADLSELNIDYRFACPWDLTGNGVVGTTDLFHCLSNWGTGPGSCDINFLFDMLANWGPCP